MTFRDELRRLLPLAGPLVLAQLAQNATSFVDTLMVGMLGNEALAGIAIGSNIFSFVMIVLSGVVLSVSAMVSQATGAGDEETCGRAVRQGCWLSLLLFVPAMLLYWNMYPILIWLRQPPETALASSQYLRAISWGLLPALLCFVMRGLLEGKSDTRPIMVVAVFGVGFNVLANYVLMFGKFGFPELGLVGTGYASSLVYLGAFLWLASYSLWRYRDLQLIRRLTAPDLSMLRQLVRIGGPIGMTLAFEASMFAAAGIGMGTLGALPLAAHQIALQTASISFMVPLGIAIATSVRVGQAIGAGQPVQARLSATVGITCCAVVMGAFALLFWSAPSWIVSWYLDLNDPANRPVIDLAIGFLLIAGIFQVADGVQVAASLSLRGLKDTFAAMLITLVSYWGVGCLSGALLAFGLGWQGRGLWLGMTLGLATAASLLLLRFRWRIGQEIRRSAEA